MAPHPGTVIPAMFKVASAWKEKRANNPQLLTQSLKQVTLVCLIKELAARAEVTFKTPDARKQAEAMGLLEGEAWVYQVWDSQKQANIRDTTRKPIPIADFQAQSWSSKNFRNSRVPRLSATQVASSPLHVRRLRIVHDNLIQIWFQSAFDEGTEDLARRRLQGNWAKIRRVPEGPARLLEEM